MQQLLTTLRHDGPNHLGSARFGKLNKATFAIVMLSDEYWLSGPCVEEVRAPHSMRQM